MLGSAKNPLLMTEARPLDADGPGWFQKEKPSYFQLHFIFLQK